MAKDKKKKDKDGKKGKKHADPEKLSRKDYDKELKRLHGELVKLQQWIVAEGAKICIIFEGRDGAGKGGMIKAITERVSPRVYRVVALPAPTDREKGQLYLQRYMPHIPSPGEIVIWDRSWYNRAGVERVMGFCSEEEVKRFLDLVPAFEKQAGYRVKTIAVGTGQALALGERGEADVLLVHAPDSEKKFMEAGHGVSRRLVMYNDFILVGPPDDPAGVKGAPAAEALKKIAAKGSVFISRGDNSGTHNLEKELWKLAGVEPQTGWYIESGQGMGATLGIADDRKAYTLTDRGTYLAFQKRVRLPILLEGDRPLLNLYSVMEVNPANGPKVNTAGGKAFADFMVSADVQRVIKTYGVDKYGQPLFVPVAGTKEEDVGRPQ